jgi:phospholipase/carboxylesterase
MLDREAPPWQTGQGRNAARVDIGIDARSIEIIRVIDGGRDWVGRARRSAPWLALFAALASGCGGATAATQAEARETAGGEVVRRPLPEGYVREEPGVVTHEAELDGMPYLEVVLGDADPRDALPLVVVLHGLGDRPSVPIGPYRDLPVAVRVVLPRAPLAWHEGYAWSTIRVLDGDVPGLTAAVGEQAGRVAAFLDVLRASLPLRGPVILSGFSQGGIVALAVAMQHPGSLGLVLPLAAWLPPALEVDASAEAPPIRWMHGTADERVPFAMAELAAMDLRARGHDVSLVPIEGGAHVMTDAEDARFHAWLSRVLENVVAGRPPAEGLP